MSFDSGAQVLIDVLAERLSEGLHTGVSVEGVRQRNGKLLLSLAERGQRGEIDTDVLVMAVPAFAAAAALVSLDPRLSEALSAIPYSPISVVALGYDQATLGNPLDGFGFLIPRGEKRKILGALWDSSVFPNRAPAGKALIRAMVGGVRNPALAALPADEIVGLTRSELAATMGVTGEPVLSRAFFHEKGIPQYLVGHGKLLDRIGARLASFPGLYLNSNAYRGIALNDCVLQSRLTAERIAHSL
jgi:oxygen-dependent protoporphyrinogen oxidase